MSRRPAVRAGRETEMREPVDGQTELFTELDVRHRRLARPTVPAQRDHSTSTPARGRR